MGPYQELPLQVRVDLGVIAMKRYSIFPKASGLEPQHHIIVGLTEVGIISLGWTYGLVVHIA